MTSRHPITCIVISVAVVLKLLAGSANAAVLNSAVDGRKGHVLLTVLHDASLHHGRGVDIAAIDGQIV